MHSSYFIKNALWVIKLETEFPIATNVWPLGYTHPSNRVHYNLFVIFFLLILRTNRQTNRHGLKHNFLHSAAVINTDTQCPLQNSVQMHRLMLISLSR